MENRKFLAGDERLFINELSRVGDWL